MGTQIRTPSKAEEKDMEQEREDWVQTTNRLLDQITEWVSVKNWTVRREVRIIIEEVLGTYAVQDAVIATPNGELRLEVKARGVHRAAGRVELFAWPTLYRVTLLHYVNKPDWIIYTDSGISLHYPWTQETFLTLAEDLMAAA